MGLSKLTRYKRAIDPFASLWCKIINMIEETPTKKLKYILNNSDLLKPTNCWWAQYQCAELIKQQIEIELTSRKFKRKRYANKQKT